MNNEAEGIWKETVIALPGTIQDLPLRELEEPTKPLLDSRYANRDLNQARPTAPQIQEYSVNPTRTC
jgi:hypothetical protein